MFDKFREECGVFGIFDHGEAANLAYLGLYALQHRGQESAGIATSDGAEIRVYREMGHVADIFSEATLTRLGGRAAVGHVRYSTAGESRLQNAQPILIDCAHGQIALCHNGNLVNANELRTDLVRQGSIFQTTSDSEVVLHLYARSRAATAEQALIESMAQVTGAFSLLCPHQRPADRGARPARIPATRHRPAGRLDDRLFRDVRPGSDWRRLRS